MKTIEKQVHVCPICDAGHINKSEYMKICSDCFRKHEIDLAFMDWLNSNTHEIDRALDRHGKKFMNEVDSHHAKFMVKTERYRRRSWMFFRVYLLFALYWLGWSVGKMIFGS